MWSSRIVPLFMESYRVVDQPTKMRMEELLATWRNAGLGGRPLFGDVAQRTIEQALFGSQVKPLAPPVPSQNQILANIERLIALGAQDSVMDQSVQVTDRLEALRELKEYVQATELSPEQLTDVSKQIDGMSPREPESQVPVSMPAQADAGSVAPPTDLIANLVRAGLLPSVPQVQAPPPAPAKPQQDQTYTDFIMSLDTRLTTADLSRPAPELEIIIQEHLPLACRQCANHYPVDDTGKSALDRHMDWHFAQNRRSKASMTRGISRTWLGSVKQWVRDGFDDVAEQATQEDKEASGDAKKEHVMMEKYNHTTVVVPMDSTVASLPCPICKEKFQSEWSEDDEEWIWRNAVEIDGIYYHASCFYSAKTMSETVTRRTSPPPASDTQSENYLAAASTEQDPLDLHLKRKAEQAAESLSDEPPLKRLADDDSQQR